jgi:hypothetical protein
MATGLKMREDSVRSFNRAVRDVSKMSRKSGRQILAQAGFNFAQSGRKATPKARANAKREVVQIQAERGQRWGVRAMYQGMPRERTLAVGSKAATMASPLRQVPRIGAAKASWWGAFRDLKKSLAQGAMRKRVSGASESGGEISPALTITNELSYLLKIAPQVESIALANAGKQLLRRAELAQKKQAERWARA